MADVAAGLSVLSGVMGFKGNMAQAKTIEATSAYEEQVVKNEAILLQRAKINEENILRQNSERLASTQRATTAASGIEMSGSPMQALADTYFNTELDALRIQYASDIEQTKAKADRQLILTEGRARAAAKRTDSYASLLSGAYQGSTMLGD